MTAPDVRAAFVEALEHVAPDVDVRIVRPGNSVRFGR